MKLKLATISLMAVFGMTSAFAQNPNKAPQNPTAKGEMKESGSEVKQAGRDIGHQTKHGHVVTGSKQFGKHMGRAGKHFGRGVKKTAKRAS
jgi:hypothetical protein